MAGFGGPREILGLGNGQNVAGLLKLHEPDARPLGGPQSATSPARHPRSAANPNAPGVSARLVGILRMLYVRFGRFYCKNLEEIAGSKHPPAWGFRNRSNA